MARLLPAVNHVVLVAGVLREEVGDGPKVVEVDVVGAEGFHRILKPTTLRPIWLL